MGAKGGTGPGPRLDGRGRPDLPPAERWERFGQDRGLRERGEDLRAAAGGRCAWQSAPIRRQTLRGLRQEDRGFRFSGSIYLLSLDQAGVSEGRDPLALRGLLR